VKDAAAFAIPGTGSQARRTMMDKQTETNTPTRIDIRQMSPAQFAELGAGAVAYIRPVLVDGNTAFAIHAANGAPMGLAESRDIAAAAITQHEMFPALVH
jgi:hypothetical protein